MPRSAPQPSSRQRQRSNAGAESQPTALAAGTSRDDTGKRGNLRIAVIPVCWPNRTAEDVFHNGARLGFEAVQCEMGIDSGWLRSHPPGGPEKGPWLAKRIASSELRSAPFHLNPDRPDEMLCAIKALRSKHHVEIACLYTGFQAHWLDVLVPVAQSAQALGCKAIKLDGSSACSERGKVFGHCASYREWLDVSRGRLREALAALRPYDVRLIFETHPWVITRNAQSCWHS